MCGFIGQASERHSRYAQYRRQSAGQALPSLAYLKPGVDLAVARAHVDTLRIQSVGIQALAIHALVVARARQAAGQPLPALPGIPGSIYRELTGSHAEVVLPVVQR